tara:strand:+ start:3848 stop:4504 length:657 start_codon:yes stop_codon:yes gene_type:complete
MSKILIVAAHPDDEWLGCGGTILKHINEGDEVQVLFVSDGYSSRKDNKTKTRNDVTKKIMNEIGANDPIFLEFPDNMLDTIPLLEIIQKIEGIKSSFNPKVVYTHFFNDLNIDHKITCNAVCTAFRPMPGENLRQLNHFEVISSTDWSLEKAFFPNYFVDVSDHFDKKMEILLFYKDEMRQSPHSRSFENVKNLSSLRGNTIGVSAAEAFFVSRMIKI